MPEAAILDAVLEKLLAELTVTELNGAVRFLAENSNNVPHELDGKLLVTSRTALGRSILTVRWMWISRWDGAAAQP